ncbi:3,8-divinyl protochlorophyllide a 8-vinylreductase [Monoraphidium neglectum]|uniref:Divinyl chlorophyllide a 8-vinyl-reductase, chloroplastic n=1 Tax=Monoraphidium neglectum TaxID=145388 RepID=A0A0D2K4V4_9CHLO|nr:3,8-divinyl protochlorophyllide a 8-vinylreductase [Monoraphidium neglectum]KIZ05498.1 3,8-divinyl protochlorophyllide a 8-vinylreductase [Monoraphidium neglectum]|eukprot:XP_013904517.1 3,8-divinyl protochlorophyllide a 8-vinylreductase [Monoraphidium neglectum]
MMAHSMASRAASQRSNAFVSKSTPAPFSGRPSLRAGRRRAVAPAAQAANAASAASAEIASRAPKDVRVVVAGPTGYIGKFVTKELIDRGYQVTALAREKAGIKGKMSKEDTQKEFSGARVVFGDVTDVASISGAAFDQPADVVVCCLASRTGGKKDSWDIDYQATKNVLDAARKAGAKHFVLLSAICVQRPLLEFQKAKLKLEAELAAAGDITYSIVRPTAFFKSLAGQVKLVQQGKPYVMFGDGNLAACKPISEADLARFMADCISDPSKHNQLLPIGGPGGALTAKQQAQILFRLTNMPEKYISAPVWLFDGIIGVLDLLAKAFPQMEDAAEFGRIGRYYATESMLVWDEARGAYDADATPEYGVDTLEGFFKKAVTEGLAGQELGDQAVFGVGE